MEIGDDSCTETLSIWRSPSSSDESVESVVSWFLRLAIVNSVACCWIYFVWLQMICWCTKLTSYDLLNVTDGFLNKEVCCISNFGDCVAQCTVSWTKHAFNDFPSSSGFLDSWIHSSQTHIYIHLTYRLDFWIHGFTYSRHTHIYIPHVSSRFVDLWNWQSRHTYIYNGHVSSGFLDFWIYMYDVIRPSYM